MIRRGANFTKELDRAVNAYVEKSFKQDNFLRAWGITVFLPDWVSKIVVCEKAETVARLLYMSNLSDEQISEAIGIPLDKIKEIKKVVCEKQSAEQLTTPTV